jgi:hypothetical protein
LALIVVSIAPLAPIHREDILLMGIDHERHGFGRLAQRDRQDAAGRRVEGARMSQLGGIDGAANTVNAGRRRHADRLVDIDPAIDRTTAATPTPHYYLHHR